MPNSGKLVGSCSIGVRSGYGLHIWDLTPDQLRVYFQVSQSRQDRRGSSNDLMADALCRNATVQRRRNCHQDLDLAPLPRRLQLDWTPKSNLRGTWRFHRTRPVDFLLQCLLLSTSERLLGQGSVARILLSDAQVVRRDVGAHCAGLSHLLSSDTRYTVHDAAVATKVLALSGVCFWVCVSWFPFLSLTVSDHHIVFASSPRSDSITCTGA